MFNDFGADNLARVNEARKILTLLEGAAMPRWEYDFIKDLRERVERYGDRTQISPKQIFKARDIKDRYAK